MLISVVIPTYREEGYLWDTLYRLSQQSMISHCEIILSDFDPDGTGSTARTARDFLSVSPWTKAEIRIVSVQKKGIGFARQAGLDASNKEAPILCNLDADGYYSTNDDLERMIAPIMNGEAVMTTCDNYIDDGPAADIVFNPSMQFFGFLQSVPILTRYEPGSCILKGVVYEAGGIADTKESELAPVVRHIVLNYSLTNSIRNMRGPYIIKSARRSKSLFQPDVGFQSWDHDYAYR